MKPLPDISRSHRRQVLAAAFILVVGVALAGYYWNRIPTVHFQADGHSLSIRTHAETVAEFLREQKIVLGPNDIATPGLMTPLTRDLPIRVIRVTQKDEPEILDVPARITWDYRTSQNFERRIWVQKGYFYRKQQIVHRILHDGQEVSRHSEVKKTVRKPFYSIKLLDEQGHVEAQYDLLHAKHYSMLATAYYVGDPMVPSDVTFMGHKLQRGLVAIDPKVLPLGWRLFIPGYGYSYSSDTGSAIKGQRIDLAVKNKQEEARYNHRKVTIYLLEKSKTW
jgi:3D (Asp-Asp-Asp) domain-containing protein